MGKAVAANIHEINVKGSRWFEQYNAKFASERKGEAIVIEVESGDYFLGKHGIEATRKARAKYPDKIFFLGKIGYPTYVSFKRGRR